MTNHMKHQHPIFISCKECEQTLKKSSEIEEHILSIHEKSKKYKYNLCKDEFILKWRLKKHTEGHHELNLRKCNFFNNNKECTYSRVGCKFLHEESDKCKYKRNNA